MKFVPRKLHAAIDVLLILFLLSYPWLFVANRGVGSLVLFGAGIALLCSCLITKYELGILRVMNFKNHLSIEFVIGIILALSPWLLNFGYRIALPHFIAGMLLVLLALTTKNSSLPVSQQEEKFTF